MLRRCSRGVLPHLKPFARTVVETAMCAVLGVHALTAGTVSTVSTANAGVMNVAKSAELLASGAVHGEQDIPASGGGRGDGPQPGAQDGALDPELLALGAPPRTRRVLSASLMFATIVAALGLLGSLRADLGYFFAEERAVDLGEATAVQVASLVTNSFVRVRGTPMASGTVHYQRVIGADTYAIFPLAGQRAIFVSVPTESLHDEARMARREWSGRLVTFGQLGGRLSGVRTYLHDQVNMPVTRDSYVLLADEPPGSYGWSLALAALCLLFVTVNLALVVRWFRPVKTATA